MTFVRQVAKSWREDILGARWLFADLHVHTLDDHTSPNLKPGIAIQGVPTKQDLHRFARHLLALASSKGIQVLGLTPHAISLDDSEEMSSVWTIVKVWNTEKDSDGIPFREKVFSVLPGFEPSFNEGKRGVHLLLLFDPETGWSFFSRAFQLLMGGVRPYKGAMLQNSLKSASEGLTELADLARRETPAGSYLCLAPHPFSGKGIFGEMGGQVMGDFPSHRLSALEVPDSLTREELLGDPRRPWFRSELARHRHSVFHASDAYDFANQQGVEQPGMLGYRVTMLKLATPRIEALRQAFIASDARVRCVYQRADKNTLERETNLPDPSSATHPWIRRVTIAGGKTFFTQTRKTQTFSLNPGLSCLIGGRMTGKSTILDGLRCHLQLPLPTDPKAAAEVQSRADAGFSAGDAEITVEFAGAATHIDDWPARFFGQNELQQVARSQEGLEDLLFNLVPQTGPILRRAKRDLGALDAKVNDLVKGYSNARTSVEVAEQAMTSASKAKEAIARYDALGGARLGVLDQEVSKSDAYIDQIEQFINQIAELGESLASIDSPLPLSSESATAIQTTLASSIKRSALEIKRALSALEKSGLTAAREAKQLGQSLRALRKAKDSEVVKAVINAGGSREELSALDKNKARAAKFERFKVEVGQEHKRLDTASRRLDERLSEREVLASQHRRQLDELVSRVNQKFDGAIRLSMLPEGDRAPLGEWVRSLKQVGVSRWWNDAVQEGETPIVSRFRAAVAQDRLDSIGMSAAVTESLRTALTPETVAQLKAIRCPDELHLEARVSEDPLVFRRLEEVSGGKRVSVLLALLLNGEDDRPLVIDQPEDELDAAFLANELLPMLRRLKGRRQIVFATHNPNIVVNGDADCVICLDATHLEGKIVAAGAIEDREVRQTIVDTVDGGEAAFELRAAKYGY